MEVVSTCVHIADRTFSIISYSVVGILGFAFRFEPETTKRNDPETDVKIVAGSECKIRVLRF